MQEQVSKGPIKPEDIRTTGKTKLSGHGFRPGTPHPIYPSNFVLTSGGLGDYICHMPAFEWIAETHPFIHGRLFVSNPFKDVATFIMGKYKHWKVYHPSEGERVIKAREQILNPGKYIKYINATGAHLMDLGAMYYAKLDRLPEAFNRLPDLSAYSSGKDWGLSAPYAVLTPGYTTEVRKMRGKYLNELSRYLVAQGITPVYLGKKVFAVNEKNSTVGPNYRGQFDPEFDPSLGIDLREKTSLLECVEIIRDAEMVLGLDNGLLHFAGCTETPIIFGHTITSVEHRSIRRPKGETINITVGAKDLPCIGCQSKIRFLPYHDFKHCLYGDAVCIDMLFGKECSIWKKAIDHILEHHYRYSDVVSKKGTESSD